MHDEADPSGHYELPVDLNAQNRFAPKGVLAIGIERNPIVGISKQFGVSEPCISVEFFLDVFVIIVNERHRATDPHVSDWDRTLIGH